MQSKVFKNKVNFATISNECLEKAEFCMLVTICNEFEKLEPEDFTEKIKATILMK